MYLSCPWDHAQESLVSFGVGAVGVWGGTGSLAGISEELHLMFMAALGSSGEGQWPQLNSFIRNSFLLKKGSVICQFLPKP